MAVTNRAKGAEKTPAWAARGKLRLAHMPGGPSRAAEMVFSGAWKNDPAEIYAACTRYIPEFIDELVAKKINAVCLTWSVGFSDDGDRAQRQVIAQIMGMLKKKKIRAIAQIGYDTAWEPELKERMPHALAWALKDAAGQLVRMSHPSSLMLMLMDVTCTAWREFVCQKAIAAVESGFDGLFLEGYDPNDDSAAFLKQIRQAALSKLSEPSLLLYTNAPYHDVFSTIFNLKRRPSGVSPAFAVDGRLTANIGVLKYMYENGGRERVVASDVRFDESASAQLMLAAAEVIACGAACCDQRVTASAVFLEEHSDINSGDPINSIGILVNDAGKYIDNIHESEHFINTLALANIQFDVIPVAQLGSFDLKKYRVLSALHLRCLLPDVSTALTTFAENHGGTVIAGSLTGTVDADDKPAERPDWLLTFGSGPREEKPLGKGRIIHHVHSKEDFGDFDHAPSSILVNAVVADMRALGEPPLECEAAPGIVCLLWGKGTKRWVHVLNYTGAPADAVISLPGCGGRKMECFSPDETPPSLEVREAGAAKAVFALKNLTTYAVVEVA
jgi:hypothetical protein